MTDFAANLRRIMAANGLTIDDVVRATGLDQRTVLGILHDGQRRPHARTLHRLATGLGIAADELFQNPALLARRQFDRRTNPVVDEIIGQHPDWFDGWQQRDFDHLYSQFGAGGQLTRDGATAAVKAINRGRKVHGKVALLLASGEADLLSAIVDLLYRRISVADDSGLGGK